MAIKKTRASVKPRNSAKEEYAYLLFMQKVPQEEICHRVGISNPTLKSWKVSGGWEEKRASRTINLDDLMQKALQRINTILDNDTDFNADAFAKAVKQLKELKNSNTVDDDINTFMSFQDFLLQQRVSRTPYSGLEGEAESANPTFNFPPGYRPNCQRHTPVWRRNSAPSNGFLFPCSGRWLDCAQPSTVR